MSAPQSAECVSGGGITICRPPQDLVRRAVMYCPTCARRRRFVVRWMGGYYGQAITCVGCGDRWCDGERAERPFQRAWRVTAVRKARQEWQDALTKAEYRAFIDAELREMFAVGVTS